MKEVIDRNCDSSDSWWRIDQSVDSIDHVSHHNDSVEDERDVQSQSERISKWVDSYDSLTNSSTSSCHDSEWTTCDQPCHDRSHRDNSCVHHSSCHRTHHDSCFEDVSDRVRSWSIKDVSNFHNYDCKNWVRCVCDCVVSPFSSDF